MVLYHIKNLNKILITIFLIFVIQYSKKLSGGENMILSDKFICAGEKYASFRRRVHAPWFKKDIKLKSDIAKAEITVCGLGFYELFVDYI